MADVWYWLAGAIFIIACGLLTLFLKKIDSGVKEVKTAVDKQEARVQSLDDCLDKVKRDLSGFHEGCSAKHKSIDESLAEGRNKFSTIEGLLREEVRSINMAVQQLCTAVGELRGSIETAVKISMNRKGDR
jgi:uncharacterized phage infection (PIP) family protein YhgE